MRESAIADRQREIEFQEFVLTQRAALYRMAFLLSGERGLAEDLVQTAFERTFARWRRLRDQDPVNYARRIIANSNVDRWRRGKGREVLTDHPPELTSDDPAPQIAGQDAVLRALADLSIKERRVIVLRFLLDMSEEETGRALKIPVGTVKSTANRAVGKLRTSPHLSRSGEVIA